MIESAVQMPTLIHTVQLDLLEHLGFDLETDAALLTCYRWKEHRQNGKKDVSTTHDCKCHQPSSLDPGL